jgi:hypothetical protein
MGRYQVAVQPNPEGVEGEADRAVRSHYPIF